MQEETLEDACKTIQLGMKSVCTFFQANTKTPEDNQVYKAVFNYSNNANSRIESLKLCCNKYYEEINTSYSKFVNNVKLITHQDIEEYNNVIKLLKNNDMPSTSMQISIQSLESVDKNIKIYYKNWHQYSLDFKLIKQYPGSYLYELYSKNSRTDSGDIYIDCDDSNHDYIMKYMKNDDTIQEDIKKMDDTQRISLIKDLHFFNLPIQKLKYNKKEHYYSINLICTDASDLNILINQNINNKNIMIEIKNIILKEYKNLCLSLDNFMDLYVDSNSNDNDNNNNKNNNECIYEPMSCIASNLNNSIIDTESSFFSKIYAQIHDYMNTQIQNQYMNYKKYDSYYSSDECVPQVVSENNIPYNSHLFETTENLSPNTSTYELPPIHQIHNIFHQYHKFCVEFIIIKYFDQL